MKYPSTSSVFLILTCAHIVQSLSYDPADYPEVYPNPRDPEVLQGRTPLYFALIQSLGGEYSQFNASGTLAGVKVALDWINNDSSLLPGYTLHYTVTNSQCNRTLSLDALYFQLLREPRKLAIIGSGCSVATEPTAEVSHYYNITQISCASGSPALSNRVRFRSYFQLQSNSRIIAVGFYELIKAHGWRRIALIVQDENLFTVPASLLKDMLDEDRVVRYDEKTFNTDNGTAGLGTNPFGKSSRIFVLLMYSSHAVPLLCEAYREDIRQPTHLLLTLGWYGQFWWREEQPNLSCTADQRESVLPSTLAITDEVFIDEGQANLTITPGITGGEFLAREQMLLGQPPLNITFSPVYSQYCHDATWTLAYALNKTLNSIGNRTINEEIARSFNITPPFRLEDFSYSNSILLDIIFRHISDTSFRGFTGEVNFNNQGIRQLYNLTIFQYRYKTNATDGSTFLERETIGNVFSGSSSIAFVAGENINSLWNGSIPYDGVPNKETVTVHPAVTSIYIILALGGIVFAIVCLIFNFIYRNEKLVKLASAKLNFLIGAGAIILYLDTVFFVIPSTSPSAVLAFCNLTPWLTAIGYSLCYGTILAKMARVYYIFNNPSTKKKLIKDRFLVLSVTSMVAIDLVILVTYSVVEGIRGNLAVQEVPNRERPMITEGTLGIITEYCIYICDSPARDIFLGILYGYKMLLQIIALLLAFSIRKVKVKGLNDAKYIGAAIYVTSIVLAVIIVATYTLKDAINGFATLFCTGFIIGTTVILMLVFIPLMIGLYTDPKGEDIFKKSSTVTSGISKDSEYKYTETEMQGLRKRIKELEDKVELQEQTSKNKNKPPQPNSETVLSALESSHMIDKQKKEISGTIWDTRQGEKDTDNETSM